MDKLKALREQRAATLGKIEALIAAAEGRDFTAEEQTQYATLTKEDDALAAQIERLTDAERRKAALATPVALPGLPQQPPETVEPKAKDPAQKGIRFAIIMRALAQARGVPYVAAQIAAGWGHEGLFANQNMSSGAAGGFLVPEDVSSEIIELLRPASVVMRAGPRTLNMPAGNMTMNRVASGAQASYVGEQQNSPAAAVEFGQVKLSAKKLAALIPISNDLIRANNQQADAIVRDDLVTALAQRMDLAFLRGPGTENSPRGLRFAHLGYAAVAATHVLAANATVNLANVTTDLGRLELALLNADVPIEGAVWFMSPRTKMFLQNLRDGNGNYAFPEVARGQLREKPIFVTTQIPSNLGAGTNESEIMLANMNHVLVGEHMGITVDLSTEAAYRDAANNLQAAFSRDETVMRAIAQHDIGVRHLQAVAVLTGVTWGV